MRPNYSIINLKLPKLPKMANKMAEFREKAASLREAARGGSPENLKTQGGGILEIFDLRGGYFGYTPPPLVDP